MLAFKENGVWIEWRDQVRPLNNLDDGGYQLPPQAERLFSDEELAAYGLVRVVEAFVPDDQRVVSFVLEDRNGIPTQVVTVETIPPTVERYSIPKDLIWRRATDAEADAMEAALNAQPARIRRIYEGATEITTDDELFGLLQSAMVQMFGAVRAGELLARVDG